MSVFKAFKIYQSNPRVNEVREYTFENDFLKIQGETFYQQFTWSKLYKVTRTKDWLYIWQDSVTALPISKKDLSKDCLIYLKILLQNNGVQNNL